MQANQQCMNHDAEINHEQLPVQRLSEGESILRVNSQDVLCTMTPPCGHGIPNPGATLGSHFFPPYILPTYQLCDLSLMSVL